MIKLRLLFGLISIAFLAIAIKLFYIQVLNSSSYSNDYINVKSLQPERGRILDRNGDSIVVNQPSYLLFAEPANITNKFEAIKKLDDILHMGEATLESRLGGGKKWVSIRKNLDDETKDKITALGLKGLGFEESRMRYYPEASLSSHILGFVGRNSTDEETGYFGIEGYYDRELAGFSGIIRSEQDLIGRPIFFGTQQRVDPENGRDLYLTIDKTVQLIVKKRLTAALESYKAKEGCAIVADPKSMQILGMSCLPDFDPSKYYDFDETYFKNPAISNLYEPGSIFKPLIMAAGIEEKAIKPDETYMEEGPVKVGGYTIRTWNNQYGGLTSMTQVLERSSNVGMVYIGEKLGHDKVYDYVKKLGFGKSTEIDLQGETSGSIKPKSNWYEIDYSTVTFGQGIAVTPIQILRAFNTVINGGVSYRPYVVMKTVGDGTEHIRSPHVDANIYSKKTSDILKKMLTDVVEHGEVKWAKPKGYTFGGKTGTAQIPIEGHYDPNKTIASFVGFGPVEDPKFIALVVIREPESSQWGSETAAPTFFEIAKDLLAYYNIPPTN